MTARRDKSGSPRGSRSPVAEEFGNLVDLVLGLWRAFVGAGRFAIGPPRLGSDQRDDFSRGELPARVEGRTGVEESLLDEAEIRPRGVWLTQPPGKSLQKSGAVELHGLIGF